MRSHQRNNPCGAGCVPAPLVLVWLPPEKQKYSQTVFPTIRAASIENACRNRRVDIRDIAFERRRAIHHRDAREADVVLQRDLLAGEFAGASARHFGFDVPGAMRVFFDGGRRPGRRG